MNLFFLLPYTICAFKYTPGVPRMNSYGDASRQLVLISKKECYKIAQRWSQPTYPDTNMETYSRELLVASMEDATQLNCHMFWAWTSKFGNDDPDAVIEAETRPKTKTVEMKKIWLNPRYSKSTNSFDYTSLKQKINGMVKTSECTPIYATLRGWENGKFFLELALI